MDQKFLFFDMRDFLGAPLGGVKINDFCWGKLFLKSSKIYRIFFYLLENYFVNIIKKKLNLRNFFLLGGLLGGIFSRRAFFQPCDDLRRNFDCFFDRLIDLLAFLNSSCQNPAMGFEMRSQSFDNWPLVKYKYYFYLLIFSFFYISSSFLDGHVKIQK